MKSVLKFFLNVLVYALIVGGVVWGAPKFLSWKLGTEYPIASITSGSMWPSLHRGDMIFIEAVPREALKAGDVVVWRNPSAAPGGTQGFTIHRLVELRETTLVTKGDANFKNDDPVGYDRLIGRTAMFRGKPFRIPYLGYVTITASKYQQ
ncbi:MAG: signal peptidase I [Candidatus Sungbacteria bacterium RIFCSPLOWO2_01_FULL_59_16]|uniref:Signal peptidase I n=1 Tax=Candidatus Sungbacteria bacterium RIFCSPLOWO2_01_FULL_59_16 TaxID=1802280 RepID=A0A1G2LCG7_9BACT|nr:MAG: signal peptidase I [Candidatus Sungbacteria bacterium RIFCSPLOWO2_01_FULL_59_16]